MQSFLPFLNCISQWASKSLLLYTPNSFHWMENRRTPSTFPPAFFTFSLIELSVIFPVYAQLNPLFHLNIVLLSLFTGAIKETKFLRCLPSTKAYRDFVSGRTFSTKSWIEISSTLLNFFLLGLLSFISSSNTSSDFAILLCTSRLENRILFTVMSSTFAKRRCNASMYPISAIFSFASSSIFFVKIGFGRL